ncbi:histidine phosphatase family protein [Tessaracoccus coleopterorum]|uniref:histidine phosphatase family protein n=1 Tax=Tessaracoccus coleopterorum TaxID=2714950 RepID=UPI0038CD7A8B
MTSPGPFQPAAAGEGDRAAGGLPRPEIDDDLVEWAYGSAEGLTSAQIQERVPGWRIWTHGAPDLGPEPVGPGRASTMSPPVSPGWSTGSARADWSAC